MEIFYEDYNTNKYSYSTFKNDLLTKRFDHRSMAENQGDDKIYLAERGKRWVGVIL